MPTISVPAGTITLSGNYVGVSFTAPNVGSITLTGLAPRLSRGISVPKGAIVLVGLAIAITQGGGVPSGHIALQGLAPRLTLGISVPAGGLTVLGQTPSAGVMTATSVTVPAGSLALTGRALALGFTFGVPAGTIVLQGQAPTVSIPGNLVTPAGAITLTGLSNKLFLGIGVGRTQIALEGLAPIASVEAPSVTNVIIPVPAGEIMIVTLLPVRTVVDPLINIATGLGQISLEGLAPTVIVAGPTEIIIPVPAGRIVLTPLPPTVTITAPSGGGGGAPTGQLFVPPDWECSKGTLIDVETGLITSQFDFPSGEAGALIHSALKLIFGAQTSALLGSDITEIQLFNGITHYLTNTSLVIPNHNNFAPFNSNKLNKFYVLAADNPGFTSVLSTIDFAGVVGGTTWTLDGSVTPQGVAVDAAEEIAYYSSTAGVTARILRHNLLTDSGMADFFTGSAGQIIGANIFVLNDGSILFTLRADSGVTWEARRYSAAGALLQTYAIGDSYSGTFVPPRICMDGEETVMWAMSFPTSDVRTSRFQEFNIATGVVGRTFELPNFDPAPSHSFRQDNTGLVSQCCPIFFFSVEGGGGELPPGVAEVPPEIGEVRPASDLTSISTSICVQVVRRLGDPDHRIWSNEEIDNYLVRAGQEMCHQTRLIWDWLYPENLPRGFSFNHAWEIDFILAITTRDSFSPGWMYGQRDGMGDGQANYTFADERREPGHIRHEGNRREDEDIREGPARHTFPDEIPFLALLGADQQQATADLPHRLTELERCTWDNRTIESNDHYFLREDQHRYEIQYGEVFQYTWRKDGPRTFRKVLIPSALADTYEIDGLWGIPRDIDDVVVDDFEIAPEQTLRWGIMRQIPGQHPMGPFFTYHPWGSSRRFYRDGKNVRVEHWRIAFISCLESELPPRYRHYLQYYAMWRALSRQGPGQDLKLAGWYKARWDTALARIVKRVNRQSEQRTGRMGGVDGAPPSGGPPRPRLPWQYGKNVR